MSDMVIDDTYTAGDLVGGPQPTSFIDGRVAHRFDGLLIAVGASVALWAGTAAGVWGVVSLFG